MPYSSPYAPPPNGPYTPAWSTQTLSPLPKQLSMPVQLPPPPPAAESPISLAGPEAGQGIIPSIPPPEPSEPPPSFPPPPMDEVQADQFSEPSHTPIDRAPTPDSPASTSSRISQGSAIGSTFVIWSRKPRDPSRAAGVIISSRAHPPDEIIQMAQDLATPPASPRVRSIKLAAPVPIVTIIEAVETASEPAPVPSSSATETTSPSSEAPDTPVPGSPLSTNTSVSAAVASPASKVEPLSSTVTLIVACGAEATAGTAIDTVPVIVETAEQPSVSEKIQSVEASTEPTSVPIKLAPPVAKKSWASLLQTSDAAASSSKSGLPRASVVGFSIPAGLSGSAGSPSSPSSGVPVRPELLNLLNDGPTGPAPPPKIRPRGLVNTGNMCFANAVLQVLVYCPPFYRLFTELGKYVSGPVVGSQKEGTNATPLIDATIQFLKEFGRKGSEVDPRAKGKEREDDFDELDSFIPTYVYDVMKEKKRFASMVGGHQEDAEEFLGFFLDTLEEELLSISSTFLKQASTPPVEKNMEGAPKQDEGWFEVGKKNRTSTTRTVKTADSPITRIFGGKFRSTLRAPHQRDSITVEDWRSLRLDIQREQVHTIKDALQYISNPHAVEISSPTRPGVVIEASRQELIESLPPVLILHLKRFEYDTKVGDVVKIGKQITFGPEMEIGSDLLSPARKTSHPVKYQLFGGAYLNGDDCHFL
ncbi:hypothetical protein EW026_g6691 [Hermanssonia centrifuga]|uniref:ubiquitinyl hydrolase 1 n=1 Tax=Hermanssonia centrifuga TaxID=98765 RepID=A0A4S4KA93_9APHY|nr:hypothetical protein EW026_g6691 [Hermanssonia centrifuga]